MFQFKLNFYCTLYFIYLQLIVYRSEYSSTPLVDDEIDFDLPNNYRSSSIQSFTPPFPTTDFTDNITVVKSSPNQSRYTINIKETNGYLKFISKFEYIYLLCNKSYFFLQRYAIVKKDAPPRPPPPARRKRLSSKSISEQPFSHRSYSFDSSLPERPSRNYNIILPQRPPRRGSSNSLNK